MSEDRSAAEALSAEEEARLREEWSHRLTLAPNRADELTPRLLATLDRERAAALPTLEVRAALQWFVENAPVSWDEDDKGCRYCGAFERTPKDHRAGCEYVAACASLEAPSEGLVG